MCTKCNKHRISSKKLENNKWATNIILHLKRFQFTKNGPIKYNDNIDIPINWRHGYRLKSFVIHRGGFGGGHYISVVRKEDEWYLCNDSSVTKISENDVNKILKQAYILYYSK